MKIAVITMVFNERVFLPIWVNHYGPKLGYENLFVIDDGSDDGSTSEDSRIINLIKKNRTPLDEEDRAKLLSCFHSELLDYYDLVIYTDVDEIIVVDPILGLSLNEYLSADNYEYKNVIGLNVIHRIEKEAQIDFDKPLFEQRKFIRFNLGYCKPLISKIPINWAAGFHWSQHKPQYDINLFLFHLRAMDHTVAKERLKTLNTVQFSANSLAKQHAFQFRLVEQDYLRLIFSTSEFEFENAQASLEFINQIIEHGSLIAGRVARIPKRFHKAIELNRNSDGGDLADALLNRSLDTDTVTRLFSNSLQKTISEIPNRRRNELCPCGSNKKFKHCHGLLV
jgi:hypothetical protein